MQNKITKAQGLKEIEINIVRELAGKQVWGDLNVSHEEYEILQDKFRTLLSYSDVNILKVAKAYPFAFVTFMIALAYYKYLYNFWGVLGEELNISVNGPLESEIGKLVKVILKKQGFDYDMVKEHHMVNLAPIFYQIGLPPESNFGDLFYALRRCAS